MSNSLSALVLEGRYDGPKEEVRFALLEAVGDLIQRYGYRKTSVEDIAQRAGVSRATAYLYFANKEAMVLHWVEWRAARRLDGLRQIAQDTSKELADPRARAERLLLTRVLVAFDESVPYMNSLQGLQGIDDLRAALRAPLLALRQRQQETEAEILADVLRDGSDRGRFKPLPDPLASARLLVLAVNALQPYNLSLDQMGHRDQVESLARNLIRLLLDGLAAEDGAMTIVSGL